MMSNAETLWIVCTCEETGWGAQGPHGSGKRQGKDRAQAQCLLQRACHSKGMGRTEEGAEGTGRRGRGRYTSTVPWRGWLGVCGIGTI